MLGKFSKIQKTAFLAIYWLDKFKIIIKIVVYANDLN